MKARWTGFRSPMATDIQEFVTAKRAIARRYLVEEKALRIWDAFLVERGITRVDEITPILIEQFLVTRSHRRARSYNHILGVVRRLFDWLVRQGRLSSSPVKARPRRQTARRIPFILKPDDVRRLLELASALPPNARAPLRAETYRTMFALMYGLGLRVGEVCRLTFGDVDFVKKLLVVRNTKFDKSRLAPFGPKVDELLRWYISIRGAGADDAPLFSFTKRGPVCTETVSQTFKQLIQRLDLVVPTGTAPPHLHCLRHAFAVETLLRWYRSGVDPAARLFHLATFMGHVSPSSTAVYLTITAELLAEGDRRFHRFATPVFTEAIP